MTVMKGSVTVSRLATVIRPHIEPGRRVLAVSDIHGNLPFLRGVLDKAGFSPADVLVLLGDLFEKGEPGGAALCAGAAEDPHRLSPVRQLRPY